MVGAIRRWEEATKVLNLLLEHPSTEMEFGSHFRSRKKLTIAPELANDGGGSGGGGGGGGSRRSGRGSEQPSATNQRRTSKLLQQRNKLTAPDTTVTTEEEERTSVPLELLRACVDDPSLPLPFDALLLLALHGGKICSCKESMRLVTTLLDR